MKLSKVTLAQNGRSVYPQWDEITAERDKEVKLYHQTLIEQGFWICGANVAEKSNLLYWILKGENGFYLERYGRLEDEMLYQDAAERMEL